MRPTDRTVVIVGAGFSGTAVAIDLLRLSHAQC
jgi:cation diffusion facilitator CzcD-associated flavoprotein CzcO